MNANEKINILMVDDQPGKLLTYEAMLGELGENLIKARSGNEALECLLKYDIAVILMDVSMPEIDGFEVAEIRFDLDDLRLHRVLAKSSWQAGSGSRRSCYGWSTIVRDACSSWSTWDPKAQYSTELA